MVHAFLTLLWPLFTMSQPPDTMMGFLPPPGGCLLLLTAESWREAVASLCPHSPLAQNILGRGTQR